MEITRRQILAAGGLGALAAVFNPMRIFRDAVAWASDPRPVYTTLERTVIRDTSPPSGFARLAVGPGEPHILRGEMAPGAVTAAESFLKLAAFAQMTDLHIVDDQSPMRVEFLDRYSLALSPFDGSYPTDGSYRPQEMLSTHLVDAMARAISTIGHGPRTALPLAFTIVTGDMVDNCQYNETRWYINLLDGNTVHPNSGSPTLDQSMSGDGLGLDDFYWRPQHRQAEEQFFRLDRYYEAGFPEVPNLLSYARAPYQAHGLGMPWYAAYGNHDIMVQGNIPVGKAWIGSGLADRAVGKFKITGTADQLPIHFDGFSESLDFVSAILAQSGVLVTPDPDRRLLNRQAFVAEHFNSTGLPHGHGFSQSSDKCYYEMPSNPNDMIRYLVLDTTRSDLEAFGPRGAIDDDQFNWLIGRLKAYSSTWAAYDSGVSTDPEQPPQPPTWRHFAHNAEDKLIVLFCHHSIRTMTQTYDLPFGGKHWGGDDLERLLWGFPNVVLMVNGHQHANHIWSHPRPPEVGIPGGFWEVNTASHIDWPSQSRIIEMGVSHNTLSIFTTMVDIDAPLSYEPDTTPPVSVSALSRPNVTTPPIDDLPPTADLTDPAVLAALARQIAANDITGGWDNRRGAPETRNCELLLPMPFGVPLAVTPVADRNSDVGASGPWPPFTTSKGAAWIWSATGLPPGIAVDAATGAVTGTVTKPGTYSVSYTVTDIWSNSATGSFTWHTLFGVDSIGQFTAVTGVTSNWGPLSALHAARPLTWSATGLPSGIALNPGTGLFYGTPTVGGTYTVTFTATDPFGNTSSSSFPWLVKVTVPDVTGKKQATAKPIVTAAGLTVSTYFVTVNDSSDGDRVIDQIPDGGALLMPGDNVQLAIGHWSGTNR